MGLVLETRGGRYSVQALWRLFIKFGRVSARHANSRAGAARKASFGKVRHGLAPGYKCGRNSVRVTCSPPAHLG